MSTTLGHKVANGAVALSLVFGLAACGESAIDLQQKPELTDLLMDRAVATCVLQKSDLDQKPYQDRLKDVLMDTPSEALRYFRDNNITVCLDRRLDKQENGFFGSYDAQGIYYPSQKILTLWDNGKADGIKHFWQSSAVSKGSTFLKNFPDSFGGWFDDYDSLSQVEKPMLAHYYTSRCGKTCTSYHYDWEATTQTWSGTLQANPALQKPPILSMQ